MLGRPNLHGAGLTTKQKRLIRKRLKGDIHIPRSAPKAHRIALGQILLQTARAARELNEVWTVNDGYRPYADQVRLWNAYKNGTGNLAAVPGTSNHGKGLALDVAGPDGKPVATLKRRALILDVFGLCTPVRGELWHIELGEKWVARRDPNAKR